MTNQGVHTRLVETLLFLLFSLLVKSIEEKIESFGDRMDAIRD